MTSPLPAHPSTLGPRRLPAALSAVELQRLLSAVPCPVERSPRGSLVLVPFRAGEPSGSLRFAVPEADPGLVARACLGALGRFGRVEQAVAVVSPGEAAPDACARLVAALEARGRALPGLSLQVAVLDEREADPAGQAVALLPVIDRAECLEVATVVDRLLDRHPGAELPRALRASVDELVRRSADGPPGAIRPASLAALIVSVQRAEGADRVLLLGRAACTRAPLTALLARACASAPGTERAAVLVVLARLLAGEGRAEEARELAGEAVRLDPHHVGARRLSAALLEERPGCAA